MWLDAPESVLTERVSGRSGDASDANADVVTKQLTYDLGIVAWRMVDAGGAPESTLKNAMQALKDCGII